MSTVQVTRSASLVQVSATRPQVAVGTPSVVAHNALTNRSDADAHPASSITFTPAGSIAATTVQSAIAEVDAEKQPLDAELTALAALTSAADTVPYFTGSGTAALTTLTAFGRSLIAAADAPAAKVALGLGLLASSVSGNTATLAGALTGARAYTLPDASMTFAGSAAALTSGRVPYVTTGGLLTDSANLTWNGTILDVAGIVDADEAIRIDRASGNPYLAFRRAAVTAGYVRSTAADTIAIETSAAAAICTFASTGITAAQAVTVPNGTAAAPGIKTSENHGLYRFSSTELGFAAGGSAAGSVTSAGRWNLGCASVTSNPTVYALRSLASATASATYECFTAQHNDTATETATWYNSTFRGKLDITGTGTNNGYDRGLTFEAYHRSTGTRAAVTGAFIETGTYNGGSDSTGTITLMRGLHINAIKTTSSTITTSALIDLGSNVGTTKYAIRTAAASGIISIGDATASTSTTTGALVVTGGAGFGGAGYFGGQVVAARVSTTGTAIAAQATTTLSAGVTDCYGSGIGLYPAYDQAFTVTRHNYFIIANPVLTNSAAVTDACLFRFDAAAGTHKAVDSGTTKTSPGTVSAWVKINISGTIHYMPAYTSKTT